MRYAVVCGGLAVLAASTAPEPESYFLLNEDTGARIDLVKTEVPAGFNIDGSARDGWTSYEAMLGDVRISVNGVEHGLPARLTAGTRVSHHTSDMFVAFSGDLVTANVSAPFNAERPDFDDFVRIADFADPLRVCSTTGTCATLEGQPLRTGDIVVVQLP